MLLFSLIAKLAKGSLFHSKVEKSEFCANGNRERQPRTKNGVLCKTKYMNRPR